jgi:hypothetical protein
VVKRETQSRYPLIMLGIMMAYLASFLTYHRHRGHGSRLMTSNLAMIESIWLR